MTTIPYNRDIPAGADNPSADRPLMTINTNSVDDIFKVDHISFDLPNGGYHTIIHAAKQGTWNASTRAFTPPVLGVLNTNQIFASNYSPIYSGGPGAADTQLFSVSGLGAALQLTGVNAVANGWAYMGGALVQWGFVSQPGLTSNNTGSVSFNTAANNISFPVVCFSVSATPRNAGGILTNAAGGISVGTLSQTGFTWRCNTTPGFTYDGFYWIALGF